MTDDDREDPAGLFDRLRELIEALDDLDEEDLDGSARIDYDYDVSVGIGGSGEDRWTPGRRDRNRNRSGDREPKKTVDVDDLDADRTYHVDVQEEDGEIVVRADLPGVRREDLSVDVEDDAVEVTVGDELVESIPVEWDEGTVTNVSFHNQVLVVTLGRNGDDGSGADGSAPDDGSESDPGAGGGDPDGS